MKKLKKYISVLAALAIMGSFAAVPVYALPAESDEISPETIEEIDESEEVPEDSDTTIEVIEDEEDAEEVSDIDTSASDGEIIEVVDSDVPGPDDPDIQEQEDAEEPESSGNTAPAATTSATAQTAAPAATTTAAAGSITYTRTDPYTMYAAENVNVRQGPGTSYSIIGSVVATNEVKVIGTNADWLVIDYYGNPGFVKASFFTSTAPETSATTAQTAPAPADTTQAPPAETTQPPQPVDTASEVIAPPAVSIEDDGSGEVKIEDDDNSAAVTTADQTPAETTSTTAAAAASTTDNNNGGGSIVGLLIALGCAVGTFLLVGVVPVVVHSIYHKKMYEY